MVFFDPGNRKFTDLIYYEVDVFAITTLSKLQGDFDTF